MREANLSERDARHIERNGGTIGAEELRRAYVRHHPRRVEAITLPDEDEASLTWLLTVAVLAPWVLAALIWGCWS